MDLEVAPMTLELFHQPATNRHPQYPGTQAAGVGHCHITPKPQIGCRIDG